MWISRWLKTTVFPKKSLFLDYKLLSHIGNWISVNKVIQMYIKFN